MILAYKFRQCPEVFWPKLQVNLLVWFRQTFGQEGYLPYTSSRVLCIFSFSHYMGKWHSSIVFASARECFHRNFRLICWYESGEQLGKRATYRLLPVESIALSPSVAIWGKWYLLTNFSSARKFFGQSLRLICSYESAEHLGKRAPYPTLPVESIAVSLSLTIWENDTRV